MRAAAIAPEAKKAVEQRCDVSLDLLCFDAQDTAIGGLPTFVKVENDSEFAAVPVGIIVVSDVSRPVLWIACGHDLRAAAALPGVLWGDCLEKNI